MNPVMLRPLKLAQGWRTSSARTNEARGLEFLGSRKPPDSSGASGSPEVRGGGHPLSVRDKVEREQDANVFGGCWV